MHKSIQIIVQIGFAVLFVILIFQGTIQLWMGIFAISLLMTLVFSRFYCGYLCPINTVMKPITFIKKKLKVQGIPVPSFLRHPSVRYISLGITASIFIFSIISGQQIPVLPLLVLIGALVTILTNESLFHRAFCPYGALLKHTSKRPRYRIVINEDQCINCGKCAKVCPSNAISKHETFHRIDSSECVMCHKCVRICPVQTIAYHSINSG